MCVGQEALDQGSTDEQTTPHAVISRLAAEIGAAPGQGLSTALPGRIRYLTGARHMRTMRCYRPVLNANQAAPLAAAVRLASDRSTLNPA